jgi:hypothetical protein
VTLILALPAMDGAALVSDTRKWFRDGSYIDGHPKLACCRDGLVTGSGSARLLDHVAAHSSRRLHSELMMLIAQTAAAGILDGEQAEWTMTLERGSGPSKDEPSPIVFEVFDGFALKPDWWIAGSVPTGLSEPFVRRASSLVKQVIEGSFSLDGIRALVLQLYVDLQPSGLVSCDFDFGTHRRGRRLSIERISAADLLGSPTSDVFQHEACA